MTSERNTFQAFVCDGASEITDDDIDTYVAHSLPSNKPQHQGRTWGRRVLLRGVPLVNRNLILIHKPHQNNHDRLTESLGTSVHIVLTVVYEDHLTRCSELSLQRNDGNDRGDGGGQRQEGIQSCWTCNGPHLQRLYRRARQANAVEGYAYLNQSQSNQDRPQDSRVSSVIYPALVTVPISAPLSLGKLFVGNRLVTKIQDLTSCLWIKS